MKKLLMIVAGIIQGIISDIALADPISLETVVVDTSEIYIACSAVVVVLIGMFAYRKMVKSTNRA
jgi:hypothetical protein